MDNPSVPQPISQSPQELGQKNTLKFKIVGISCIIFGILQLILPLIQLIFVIPQLLRLYSSLNIATPPSLYVALGGIGIALIWGGINIFLGIKLVSKNGMNNTLFKYGLISLLLALLLSGVIMIITISSLVSPLYNISSQLK